MPLIQLLPYSPLRLTKFKEKDFDVIIILEGSSDIKILNTLIKKLNIQINFTLALTYCSSMIIECMAAVVRYSRKIRTLGIVVDANSLDYKEEANKIIDGLQSFGIRIT